MVDNSDSMLLMPLAWRRSACTPENLILCKFIGAGVVGRVEQAIDKKGYHAYALGNAIRERAGNDPGWVIVFSDVSEAKKAVEEELGLIKSSSVVISPSKAL